LNYYFISEQAFTIYFNEEQDFHWYNNLHKIANNFIENSIEGIVDIVPTTSTISFFYTLSNIKYKPLKLVEVVIKTIKELNFIEDSKNELSIKIPICFHPTLALDLNDVCNKTQQSDYNFKQLFLNKTYTVAHLGFLPGFPYITGLQKQLHVKRKSIPNAYVKAKSVAIANDKIGIYPYNSPGGWHVVAGIPFNLFDITKENPFLLSAGNIIEFYEIDYEKYLTLLQQQNQILKLPQVQHPTVQILKSVGVNTIQSLPRFGFLSKGVPVGGAMIPTIAKNLLSILHVDESTPVIELAMGSLHFKVIQSVVFAFAGSVEVVINKKPQQENMAIELNEGDDVQITFNGIGMYGYIAFKGLINVPKILNSYSTSVNAQIGYWFQKNDVLEINTSRNNQKPKPLEMLMKTSTIRCFVANEFAFLTKEAMHEIVSSSFEIDAQANRMAIKLKGEPLHLHVPLEMSSTAVAVGTVQLTPNGTLMILMNDAQSTGGYPRVLQVIHSDIELLAMHKPGEKIQFKLISFEEACQFLLLNNK
jgi:antagonist of KipI